MIPTIRFVLVTALRDRLFASLFGLLAVTIGISVFLGGGAIMESREMAVVYAAGGARVFVMLGLIVFTAFHVERLYDTREIEAILARAISRESFVVSYWTGLAVIGILLVLPVAVAVFTLGLSVMGAVYWSVSIVLEALMLVAFVLFCALTMERAIPTIFAGVGFYVLARLVSFLLGIVLHGRRSGVNEVINPIFKFISFIVPRLDLAGQTRWLVYGVETNTSFLGLIAAQAAIYVPLLLLATIFDLRRKNF